MKAPRRTLIKRFFNPVTRLLGSGVATEAIAETQPADRQDVPLYSSVTRQGNMLFIFGIGAHFEGDIKAHTDHVLNEMNKELTKAGSSMEKVLKVSVFLHDLDDYKGMNEVYKGRFGPKPPVRTTVAPRAGVPGNSLVEMDCIAYI